MPAALRDRVSVPRAAFAVFFIVVTGALGVLAWTRDGPLPPLLVVLFALTAAYLGASAFDAVRGHPAFTLASAVYSFLLFSLWTLLSDEHGVLLPALAAVSLVGVLVEAYNYRHGTSYLRLDLGGSNDAR